jgi:hypothetical protein
VEVNVGHAVLAIVPAAFIKGAEGVRMYLKYAALLHLPRD